MSDQLKKENDSGSLQTDDVKDGLLNEMLLAEQGREAITRAEGLMSGLMECRRRHGLLQPLHGARIAGCSYLDAKTAVLIETLIALGAEVQWTNTDFCDNVDEQKAVVAALKQVGISVYQCDDSTKSEGRLSLFFPLEKKANVILDDFGLLTEHAAEFDTDQKPKAVIAFSKLRIAECLLASVKNLSIFNAYELLEKAKLSSYHGKEEVTVKVLAPDNVCAILGYSARGKSFARALRSTGVKVLIVEPNGVNALEAKKDSFELVTLQQAFKRAKAFVFATDCLEDDVDSIAKMKDNSLICNIGTSDADKRWLLEHAEKVESPEVYLNRFKLKNGNHVEHLDLKCLDRVGSRSANGVSYSYTLWLLATIHVWSKQDDSAKESHTLPDELVEEAARLCKQDDSAKECHTLPDELVEEAARLCL